MPGNAVISIKKKKIFFSISCAIFGALVCFFVFVSSVMDVALIRGRSMEPDFPEGSLVVINKLAYGLRLPWAKDYTVIWNKPEIDDIIMFRNPETGEMVVKRCTFFQNKLALVTGNNPAVSRESDYYGPVPLEVITGRVLKFNE